MNFCRKMRKMRKTKGLFFGELFLANFFGELFLANFFSKDHLASISCTKIIFASLVCLWKISFIQVTHQFASRFLSRSLSRFSTHHVAPCCPMLPPDYPMLPPDYPMLPCLSEGCFKKIKQDNLSPLYYESYIH